jgi:hypothetical protein
MHGQQNIKYLSFMKVKREVGVLFLKSDVVLPSRTMAQAPLK